MTTGIIPEPNLNPNEPAFAEEMNARFDLLVKELNELGTNGVIASDAITSTNIADNAITQDKINITTGGITDDDHIITKKYFEDNYNSDFSSLFGAPVTKDSESDPLGGIIDGGGVDEDTFNYNVYKATSDGFLNIIPDDDVDELFVVAMVSSTETEVTNAKIGKTYDKDGGTGYNKTTVLTASDIGDKAWPDIVRAICHTRAGTEGQHQVMTTSIPIRKDDYIKIHASEHGETGDRLSRAIWFPFGAGQLEKQDDA